MSGDTLLMQRHKKQCNYRMICVPTRVEFTFSTYLNGTELVNAVQNLNYKGGNTRTGAGLKFVSDNFFNPISSRDALKVNPSSVNTHLSTCFFGVCNAVFSKPVDYYSDYGWEVTRQCAGTRPKTAQSGSACFCSW